MLYAQAMSIGSRLRQLRQANKMSGQTFGEMCGVTKGMVSQWESDMSIPPVDRLIELHKRLDFSFDWLLNGAETGSGSTYTTADRSLVAILKALEPRADYIKESVLQNVINTCKLADQMHPPDTAKQLAHRLPASPNTEDRKITWLTDAPRHRRSSDKGDKQ